MTHGLRPTVSVSHNYILRAAAYDGLKRELITGEPRPVDDGPLTKGFEKVCIVPWHACGCSTLLSTELGHGREP